MMVPVFMVTSIFILRKGYNFNLVHKITISTLKSALDFNIKPQENTFLGGN